MHSLTPEQWNDHIVYLTRENPKTSIQGVGGYLTKLTQPFDIEDIKNAFGGYEFSYIMKNKNEVAYSGRFKVEAPPRLDSLRERDGNAHAAANGQNDLVQQFITVLREELTRTREAMQAQPNGSGEDAAVKIIAAASERAMDVIKAQIHPAKTLESLVNTAKSLGVFGQPAQGGGVLETITALKTLGLIGQPAPDPMQQLTMFITLFTKLDDLRGSGAGGGARHWPEILAEKAVDHIPDVLNAIREGRDTSREIADKRLEAARTNERAVTAMRSAPSPTAPNPAAVARPSAAAAGPAVSPLQTVPLGEAAAPAAAVALDQTDVFSDWLKRRMVALIREGANAEAIVDFLDGAKPGFANDLVAFPPDQVTAFLAADPILKDAVADPRWPQLLAAARAYILEEAPEPIPASLKN